MTIEPVEYTLPALLAAAGSRLATAESCTGGLIGHRLTNVPGSSEYYLGGVTAYANAVKTALLGVPPETIERYGAVSEPTVLAMAAGAGRALGAQLGLAVSGVAGPGGGSAEKPVGTVWIGLAAPGFARAWRYLFPGERETVKALAAEAALQLLAAYLRAGGEPAVPSLDALEQALPLAVAWRFDADGRPVPQQFTWRGAARRIEAIGRRWSTPAGEHLLARLPDGEIFELVYHPPSGAWRIAQAHRPAQAG
jgi:PncC family amidohydrolase